MSKTLFDPGPNRTTELADELFTELRNRGGATKGRGHLVWERHQKGDFGNVSKDIEERNYRTINEGFGLVISEYKVASAGVVIVTTLHERETKIYHRDEYHKFYG